VRDVDRADHLIDFERERVLPEEPKCIAQFVRRNRARAVAIEPREDRVKPRDVKREQPALRREQLVDRDLDFGTHGPRSQVVRELDLTGAHKIVARERYDLARVHLSRWRDHQLVVFIGLRAATHARGTERSRAGGRADDHLFASRDERVQIKVARHGKPLCERAHVGGVGAPLPPLTVQGVRRVLYWGTHPPKPFLGISASPARVERACHARRDTMMASAEARAESICRCPPGARPALVRRG
jgi:hypothetical protein